MSVESWVSGAVQYGESTVLNSAELQTAIEVKLLAAGWTNPSANVWKSVGAKWIQLTFSQPAGTKLAIALADYLSRTSSTRRIGVVANPSTWQIQAAPSSLYVWGSGASTGWLMCGILDHFPESSSSHTLDGFIGTEHDAADATGYTADKFEAPEYLGTYEGANEKTANTKSPDLMKSASGLRRDLPVLVWCTSASGVVTFAGRMPNAIYVSGSVSKDVQIPVPLDVDNNATFRTTGIIGTYGSPVRKIAVRIA